jgi:hypothetical protein
MYKKPTVFIIGAGCSHEFGLPLGPQLSDLIFEAAGGTNANSAHSVLRDAFITYRASESGQGVERRLDAFARGIHAKQSIDQYLHFHRDDPATVALGKCAIAHVILSKERSSLLAETNIAAGLSTLRDTWLLKLFHGMNADTTLGSVADIFSNVSFICFNYDRCIELALFNAIRMLTYCSIKQATAIMTGLRIWHPYGMVGDPAYAAGPARDLDGFAAAPVTREEVLQGARRLRTFMEGMEDDAMMAAMDEAIAGADQIVFLGFSYLDQNMELLATPCRENSRIFANCYGLSGPDTQLILTQLATRFPDPYENLSVRRSDIIPMNMPARLVFDDYGNTLRR